MKTKYVMEMILVTFLVVTISGVAPVQSAPVMYKHDVVVIRLTVPHEAVQGEIVPVDIDVANLGDCDESVTLSVFIKETGTTILEKTITLAKDVLTTETVDFDASDVAPSIYTLRAEVTIPIDDAPDNNWKERRIDFRDIKFDGVDDQKPKFVPGEVLVGFRTNISPNSVNDTVTTGITSIDELNERFRVNEITQVLSNVYKLTLSRDANVLSIAREYEANPNVRYAEPNYIYSTFVVPNDGNYTWQWAHQRIESEFAWNITTGDPNVVIAIVDTGVDWDHPDLAANIWNNTDEYPIDGNDTDNNGFIDDVRGWDFVDTDEPVAEGEDGTVRDNDPMDFHGHGTFCSGIAAAVTNNTIGIAGMAWNCKIMPVRAGYKGSDGRGYVEIDDAAAAIEYAADNGADIISMSFGSYSKSETLYDALKHAYDSDVLLVASAGNDMWTLKVFPAAHEEVIAVTATDENDDPAVWYIGGTNFGDWVELAAPGKNIHSTWFDDTYWNASGTSAAAPHVAGVGALIWSQFPSMTRDQVRVQLRRTAVDKNITGFDIYYGYGRINASGAIEQTPPDHDLLVLSWKLPFASEPGDPVAVNTTVLNFGNSIERNIKVKLLVNGTVENSTKIDLLQSGASETVSISWTSAEGKYNVTTYVDPKEDETVVENNAQSAYAWVRYGRVVKVPEDFATIKEAVNATNLGKYYGDTTIWVASGTYPEYNLIVQNSLTSLTLAGENRSTTIIEGPGDVGVWVHTNNVTITGFTIQTVIKGIYLYYFGGNIVSNNNLTNCSYDIYLHYSSGNIVSNNIVTRGTYGIYLSYSSNNTASNNTSLKKSRGIYLSHSSNNAVSNNTFSNSTGFYTGQPPHLIRHPGAGILLAYSSDNNTISGNTLQYDEYSIHLLSCSNNTVSNNTISSEKPDAKGIYLQFCSNNTISANTVSNNTEGISLDYSDGNTVSNNTVSNNNYTGILLYNSDGNTVIDNTVSNNTDGIYPYNSNSNTIRNNTVLNNDHGIYLYLSYSNTVGDNIAENNTWYGIGLSGCNGNSVSNNTVSSNYYGVYLNNASGNNAVSGNTVSNNDHGIYLYYSEGNTVNGNVVSSNFDAIYLYMSSGNTISNNTVSNNDFSIHLWGTASYGNNISHNTVKNNTWYGVRLTECNGNTINNNTVSNNDFYGINLQLYCENNTVIDNMISSNGVYGIYLYGSSNNNNFSANTVSYNVLAGIKLTGCYNNTIYHNNFIENTNQADTVASENIWDDGYPSGGNYWSDHVCTGNPSNGTQPYIIDADNIDHYPFEDPNGWL